MTALPQGIVFPQSVLSWPTFIVFATFVAINTVIYLGLTVSKFAPWPPQVKPARVRAILPPNFAKDVTMKTLSKEQRHEISDPFLHGRWENARRTLPLAFILVGTMIIVSSLVGMLLLHTDGLAQYIGQFIGGVFFIGLGQFAARRGMSGPVLAWLWIGATVAVVLEVSWDAVIHDSSVVMVYAVVTMTALMPVTMSWRPAIVGGAASLIIVVTSGILIDQIDSLPWTLAAMTAVIIGGILLYLRLTGIDALTLEQMRANTLATTDPLTGLLTRSGLLSVSGTIVGAAERAHEPVCVVQLDIQGMRGINEDYGVEFGDDALGVVAQAIRAVIREGDLVCRWSGDTFLVLGVGEAPDPTKFADRVDAQVAASGAALGKRPILVRAGSASGRPGETSFEALEIEANVSRRAGR